MAIVRIDKDRLEPLPTTSLRTEGLRERLDLQRLLKTNIGVIGPDLLVIAEEFGEWEESRRRVDLLALDREGNLVVIELKREDCGHMELQAVRYAAMVSAMTFAHVVSTYQAHLETEGSDKDAREDLVSFLAWEDEENDPAIGDAQIVLVAEDFSKELTTSVLWLIGKGLDIRCVRLQPYRVAEQLLADVEQVIPLKSAEEYIIRLREKRQEQRQAASGGGTMEEFWSSLPTDLHPPARELLDWLEPHVSYLWPGRGGCVPVLKIAGIKYHIFRMRTDGQIAIYFDWMKRKPPFNDRARRHQLLEKLNAIEGVNLPAEKLEGRPRLNLAALRKPESMIRFQEAVHWWLDQVKNQRHFQNS
jgi:hypothetical protein